MVHSARMMNTIAIISLNEHDRGSMLYQATPFQESVVSVRFNSTSTNVVVGLKCPHPPGQGRSYSMAVVFCLIGQSFE